MCVCITVSVYITEITTSLLSLLCCLYFKTYVYNMSNCKSICACVFITKTTKTHSPCQSNHKNSNSTPKTKKKIYIPKI